MPNPTKQAAILAPIVTLSEFIDKEDLMKLEMLLGYLRDSRSRDQLCYCEDAIGLTVEEAQKAMDKKGYVVYTHKLNVFVGPDGKIKTLLFFG